MLYIDFNFIMKDFVMEKQPKFFIQIPTQSKTDPVQKFEDLITQSPFFFNGDASEVKMELIRLNEKNIRNFLIRKAEDHSFILNILKQEGIGAGYFVCDENGFKPMTWPTEYCTTIQDLLSHFGIGLSTQIRSTLKDVVVEDNKNDSELTYVASQISPIHIVPKVQDNKEIAQSYYLAFSSLQSKDIDIKLT